MNGWRGVGLAMLVAALAGCSGGPALNAHIETLNNEYRQLEDQFYSLEGENQQLCLEIKQLEKELVKLRGGDTSDDVGPLIPRMRRPSSFTPRPSLDLEPPTIEIPGSDATPALPDLSPPNTVAPPRTAPPMRAAPKSSLRKPLTEDDLPELEGPAIEAPPTENLNPPVEDLPLPPEVQKKTPTAPEPIDPRVTHLFLNPTLTGGNDFDQQPGDDGLSILIEPRNHKEQYVPQAGAVSIVVLDPAQQGEASRIARWDFDASTMREKLERVSAADGLHLQLPWPAKPPEHNRLKLFVRYETADGRQLQTDREIFVALPGEVSNRWTPRPSDKPRTASAVEKRPVDLTPIALPAVPVKEFTPAPATAPAVASPAVTNPPAIPSKPSGKLKLIVPPPALGESLRK